jgi:integrase
VLRLSVSSLVVLEGDPYLNFINSLKSKDTKRQYRQSLVSFIKHYDTTLEGLLSLTPKDIEQMITNYITNLNARGLSHGYINLVMCAIFHFFDMNDVVLNKRKIGKFKAERKKMNKDRAYEHEEIKLFADTGDYRFKALIYLLASTGVRIGCIPSLLVRHLERKENDIYKVTIYENTSEEYYCFTTPEATKAIDQYLDYRRRASEDIKPYSPLFRNDFNMSSIERTRKNSKPVALETLRNIMHKRLLKVGLIEKYEHDYQQQRHNVPMSHGFRKFWMNQAVNKAKMNPEIREMLLGHRIGIASSYYRPTEDEMLTEFEKAIDALTINPENRLKRRVEKLEVEKSQVEALAAEITEIKNVLKKM